MSTENQTLISASAAVPADCESEQLHRSGAIQPHGALVVVGIDGAVSHVSDNAQPWLGREPREVLGHPVPDEFLWLVAELPSAPRARFTATQQLLHDDRRADVVASRAPDGSACIEIFPVIAAYPQWGRLGASQGEFSGESDVAAARDQLVGAVLDRLEFKRVMYYEFVEGGDGLVRAEARSGDVYGSYLGLRFPASDIPQIARAIYRDNPWRLIADAQAVPVPVVAREAQPPDMSYVDLRSASPVHRVYLGNMNVRASLSFPVLIGGELAALIACHDSEAHAPSIEQLEDAALLTSAFALSLAQYTARERMSLVDNLDRRVREIARIAQRAGDLDAAWPELGPRMMEEYSAHGAALVSLEGVATMAGDCPGVAAIGVIDARFRSAAGGVYWATDALAREVPEVGLAHICGVLAFGVRAAAGSVQRIYIFRREQVYEVPWGGQPQKPHERVDGRWAIAPRLSFERWVEKRVGHSRPWLNTDKLLTLRLRQHLMRDV